MESKKGLMGSCSALKVMAESSERSIENNTCFVRDSSTGEEVEE